MDRRTFLGSALSLATVPVLARAHTKEPEMIPAIDTHQHLWDLKKFKLSWLTKGSLFDAQFTPAEYAAAIEGCNVVKSVYMEVDVVEEQQTEEARYVEKLCEEGKTTMAAAVISGRPASEQFATYIAGFKDSKFIKGVRQVLHVDSTPSGYMLGKEFIKGVQLLGDLGMSFDLCVRPTDLGDVVKLVEACPDTRFILDHCGNPNAKFTAKETEAWKTGLAKVAEARNVMVKVSGIVANGFVQGKWTVEDLAPFINTTIDTFGVKRAMFGGDWPVCTQAATYKEWITALRTILASRPEADQRAILHDNANKFYQLNSVIDKSRA